MSLRSTCLFALACAGVLPAQAGSATWFLAAAEAAPGGTAQSTQYVLTASFGAGVVPARGLSGGYVLEGGYPAMLDAPAAGQPWLTGATPRFSPMRSGAAVSLHGTELNLGTGLVVTVGGVPATVSARTNGHIDLTLPPQPVPGWQPAEVTTTAGNATLPRAVGVLPMIEAERPVVVAEPGVLVYRGRQGDFMVWGFSATLSPFPIPIAGLGYGLRLGFASLFTTGTSVVTDPSGESRLVIPPFPVANPFYMQAAAITPDPGYAPGAFTNAIRIF